MSALCGLLLSFALPAAAGASLELEALASSPAALHGAVLDGSAGAPSRCDVLASGGAGLSARLARFAGARTERRGGASLSSAPVRSDLRGRSLWGYIGLCLGCLGSVLVGAFLLPATAELGTLVLAGVLVGWALGDIAYTLTRRPKEGRRRKPRPQKEADWSPD